MFKDLNIEENLKTVKDTLREKVALFSFPFTANETKMRDPRKTKWVIRCREVFESHQTVSYHGDKVLDRKKELWVTTDMEKNQKECPYKECFSP